MTAPIQDITIDVGGIPFGQVDADGFEWIWTTWKGWTDPPPSESKMTDREAGHGAAPGRLIYRRRTITVSGTLAHDDPDMMQLGIERLASIIGDGGYYPFEVNSPGVGYRSATVQRADIKIDWDGFNQAAYQLTVVSPDHRKYGPSVSQSTPLAGEEVGGLDDLGTGLDDNGTGLDSGTTVELGIVRVTNIGRAPSDPLIYLEGGTTGLVGPINVRAAGRTLTYDGDIAPGDFLLLDCGPRKGVLYNGYATRRELLTRAEWPEIAPQDETAFFWEHAGGSTGDGRMRIVSAPAYL